LIAVREQPALAVYLNNYGQVTLRRERSWDEEDDCFIQITKENVLTVVRAILVAAGMEDLNLYSQHGMACRTSSARGSIQPAGSRHDGHAARHQLGQGHRGLQKVQGC
jgi:hypothetical protein